MRPSRSAARETPAAIDEKKGSAIPLTSSAAIREVPRATAWAERFVR